MVTDLVADAIAARPESHLLLLFLEFDAALCDSGDAPTHIAPHRRALLALLANQPDTLVAVLGTARAADLAHRVGVGDPVIYLGLRGLEISGHGLDALHPDVASSAGLIGRLARALAALTDPLPGVRLEDHELALTLHVRDASEADADLAEDALYRVAESQIAEKIVRCYRAAEAFELVPCVGSDEGDACASLVDALARCHERPVWPVCVADDVRGDSMFDVVASTGLSVAEPRVARST